jgi:hypothetical protein
MISEPCRAASGADPAGFRPVDSFRHPDAVGRRRAFHQRRPVTDAGRAPADRPCCRACARAAQARAGDPSHPDQEILRTPPEILTARSRSAGAVEADAWRSAEGSDGRWLWLAAVILLGIEQTLRRPASRESVEVRDAA